MDPSVGQLKPAQWLEEIEKGRLDLQFEENLGADERLRAEHRSLALQALHAFRREFGDDRPVAIVRSPGRINLIGMHVDHRGFPVNPIAVKETLAVAAARNDDTVRLVNVDPQFARRSFRISEELPAEPVKDWDDWTAKNLPRLAQGGLSGDWSNYARASGCYFANFLWKEKALPPASFKGLDAAVASNMPMAVGLSSSSALVVAMALLFCRFNGIEAQADSLIDHCGIAEWFVGTRGGKGDHAAILLGRQGKITHIAFFPFSVRHLSFPPEYRVVICNSLLVSRKGEAMRHAFNERIASYEIGFLLLKKIAGKHGLDTSGLNRMRDFTPDSLALDDRRLMEILLELPGRIGRREAEKQLGGRHAETLRKVWQTHPEPAEGYPVRDVCLYGIAEGQRSRMAASLLEAGRLEEFGRIMNVSHDGDRVSRWRDGVCSPWSSTFDRDTLAALDKAGSLILYRPGGYRVSTPEIDRLVDIALGAEGVLGARLTGAGHGGCVVVLCHLSAVAGLLAKLEKEYYSRLGQQASAEVCQPLAGANFFRKPESP